MQDPFPQQILMSPQCVSEISSEVFCYHVLPGYNMIVCNLFYNVSVSEDYLISNNWLIVDKDLKIR